MLPKMGINSATDPGCANCHGNLTKVATDLKAGRKPWLQEPTCAQCHGAAYSTGTTLYRNARGHGGIQCITCHNSPHAWWPSRNAADNLLPDQLQKNTNAIGNNACYVCHTDGRKGAMPPHHDD
jgi:mono/diheme cytochrome c family protein